MAKLAVESESIEKAPKIKASGGVSRQAEILGKLTESIFRINTLTDAKKLLDEAVKLDKSGNKPESKKLLHKVFGQLFRMEAVRSDVGMVDIQGTIQREGNAEGAIKVLSEMLEDEKVGGGKKYPTEKNDFDKVSKDLVDKDDSKRNKAWDKTREVAKNLESRRTKLENDLFQELEQHLAEISGDEEEISKMTKLLHESLEIGMLSKEKAKESLGALKDSLQQFDYRAYIENEEVDLGVINESMTNEDGILDKMAKFASRPLERKVAVNNMTKVIAGLNKVVENMGEGASVSDAIRLLSGEEFRELRSFVATLRKMDGAKDVDTHYFASKQYEELLKKINLSDKDKSRITIIVQRIELAREEVTSGTSSSTPSSGEKSVARQKFDSVFKTRTTDFEGNIIDPVTGIEHSLGGNVDFEAVREMYSRGNKNLDDLVYFDEHGVIHIHSLDEQLRRKIEFIKTNNLQNLENRESFMNISMQELHERMIEFDSLNASGSGMSIAEMVDWEEYARNGVAKLKDEYLFGTSPELKKQKQYFEDWWRDEAEFEVRRMAYEGVFEKRSASVRMKRWNSLNEILGVSTTIKSKVNLMAASFAVIDQQNNSLSNQELFLNHAKFWGGQGVDFRWEHLLKMQKEKISLEEHGARGEAIGSMSMFDALTFQQLVIGNSNELDVEIRKLVGMPDSCKDMTYGTLLNKYADADLRDKVRRAIWNRFATAELGTGLELGDMWKNLKDDQKNMIYERYSNIFEFAQNYASIHQMLHTMIGNASFVPGKVELPAAMAEGHLKNDLVLYRGLFVHRFDGLGARFPELYAYCDSGLRDHVTLAKDEYAGAFVGFSAGDKIMKLEAKIKKLHHSKSRKDKKQIDELKIEIENEKSKLIGKEVMLHPTGSETIFTGLLGKKVGDVITKDDVENALVIQKTFYESLFHWGHEIDRSSGHSHASTMDDLAEWGVTGEYSTAFRRRAEDSRRLLRAAFEKMDDKVLSAINWDKYASNFGDVRLEARLKEKISPRDKAIFVADTWGDASYKFDAMATKRVPDLLIKYAQEYGAKYLQDFLAFMKNPNDIKLESALNEQVNAINATAVSPLQKKRKLALISYFSNELGYKILGGDGEYVISRSSDSRSLKIDDKNVGPNGLPLWKKEEVFNDNNVFDPLKSNTAFARFGWGRVGRDERIEEIIGALSLNHLTKDDYEELMHHLKYEPFERGKLGTLTYLLRWLNMGEPLMEFIAPYLGITAHELRHITIESLENSFNMLSQEILGVGVTGGGGGGKPH